MSSRRDGVVRSVVRHMSVTDQVHLDDATTAVFSYMQCGPQLTDIRKLAPKRRWDAVEVYF